MKTIKDVKEEIADLVKEGNSLRKGLVDKSKEKRLKQLSVRVAHLAQCVLFLEHNPTEEYCKSAIQKLLNKIELISSSYIPYGGDVPKRRKEFETKMGVPAMKEQLKVLKYLLNK
jgi:hypothetical protein